MATIIYATVDVALIPVFGLDPGWVPIISVILAVITVIYTTMGGLKAVVLTDVIQTVVMFAGVLLTIGIIGGKVGSVGAFFEPQLFEHWPPIEWGFDPSKRMTVGNILLMTLVWQVCTAGSDQMAIQRYLSTPDVATAKRSYRISLITSCTIQLLLAVVGLVVMTYFLRYPQMLAPGTSVTADADTLFPRFILIGLPAGITGLTQKPPKGDIKPLSGYTDGRFRLRVGGYRVIYKIINDAIEILYVIDIGVRGDIYK